MVGGHLFLFQKQLSNLCFFFDEIDIYSLQKSLSLGLQ